jgi:PHD/YefM family antitoxin component YafN of YafNO toxin-antitoxin module
MSENLEKIVNLIRKTGDKAIIIDAQGNPSYVIMTISDYERLMLGKSEVLGLTEQELLDKINRDINFWKEASKQQETAIDQYDFSKNFDEFEESDELIDFESNLSNFSENIVKSADEDRYYFEPVE